MEFPCPHGQLLRVLEATGLFLQLRLLSSPEACFFDLPHLEPKKIGSFFQMLDLGLLLLQVGSSSGQAPVEGAHLGGQILTLARNVPRATR